MPFSATLANLAFIPIAYSTLTNYEVHIGDHISNQA